MREFFEGIKDSEVGTLNRRNYLLLSVALSMVFSTYFFVSAMHRIDYLSSESVIPQPSFSAMDYVFLVIFCGVPGAIFNAGRMNDIGINGWWAVGLGVFGIIFNGMPVATIVAAVVYAILLIFPGKAHPEENIAAKKFTPVNRQAKMPHTYYRMKGDDQVDFVIGTSLNVKREGGWVYAGSIPQTVTLPQDGSYVEYMIHSENYDYVQGFRMDRVNSRTQTPDIRHQSSESDYLYDRISDSEIYIKQRGKIYILQNNIYKLIGHTPAKVQLDISKPETGFEFYPVDKKSFYFTVVTGDLATDKKVESQNKSAITDIERLENLLKREMITRDEYESLKSRIISA